MHINIKTKTLICAFAISIALTSCRTPRFVYSPAPPNNPYFREKGESKIAAYYSTAADENDLQQEYNDGLDLQAAYAVSDHFALTADYFKRNEKDVFKDYDRSLFDSSVIRYDRISQILAPAILHRSQTTKRLCLTYMAELALENFLLLIMD